ncbi:MAG: hypothetical protein BWY88_00095 [Synergistetes bacterium ADurb.Bin520]|nr:MAG: hypothetical protein BWY88_00095 [Synergistetes bacterium ADurb.Bin520]
MVKRSRLQSHEAPNFFSWLMMRLPYCSFQAQTRSTKASRPRSRRDVPSEASWRSTTFWVAMPAWSVPGSHRTLSPCMRCQRHTMSCSVLSSACPRWRDPVTFGGGMTMQKGFFPSSWGSARKRSSAIHAAYRRSSMGFGSYALPISPRGSIVVFSSSILPSPHRGDGPRLVNSSTTGTITRALPNSAPQKAPEGSSPRSGPFTRRPTLRGPGTSGEHHAL